MMFCSAKTKSHRFVLKTLNEVCLRAIVVSMLFLMHGSRTTHCIVSRSCRLLDTWFEVLGEIVYVNKSVSFLSQTCIITYILASCVYSSMIMQWVNFYILTLPPLNQPRSANNFPDKSCSDNVRDDAYMITPSSCK